MKWEFLKYEICKFTISFSKSKTKYMREKKLDLEEKKQLKRLEGKLNCDEAEDECNICNKNLNVIYNEIANGIKGCVRCLFTSLFFMSEREHFRNKEKCFLFYFKSFFRS